MIRQLRKKGWDIHAGLKIEYVLLDVNNKNPNRRYVVVEDYNGKFDYDKYVEMMVKATVNLVQSFGVDERGVRNFLRLDGQMRLV